MATQLMLTSAFGMRGNGIGGGAVETVTVRAGSVAEWMAPVDMFRSPDRRFVPENLVQAAADPTKLEQFLDRNLAAQGIREPIGRLREYLARTMERFNGANMLDRVAYGYYRPTRLAELQVSITQPLARIVDARQNGWEVAGTFLTEAARNLDVAFPSAPGVAIDLSNPHLALRQAAQSVNRAHTLVGGAFAKLTSALRTELETSMPKLLDTYGRNVKLLHSPIWHDRSLIRSRVRGQGESDLGARAYEKCQCYSWSRLLDAGGTPDFYSGVVGRGDGMVKSTGSIHSTHPEWSTFHGLFIDTPEKISFWP